MTISNNFNITASILTSTNVGTKIQKDERWAVQESVAGTLNQLSGNEIIKNEGNTVDADYLLYIDVTTIDKDNRVKIGSDTYSVYRIHNPNQMDRHLEVYLKILGDGVTTLS